MKDATNPKAFIAQFLASLPPGIGTINQAVANHLQVSLNAWFTKLNLVTREEFEVQMKVLAKTREKVERLEAALKSQ